MAWIWLLIQLTVLLGTLLATMRLTRLVVDDAITDPMRRYIHARAEPKPLPTGPKPALWYWRFLSALIVCSWCASIWVSAALSAAYWHWQSTRIFWEWGWHLWFQYGITLLALSYLTGLAKDWLDSPPPARQLHIREIPPIQLVHRDKTTP